MIEAMGTNGGAYACYRNSKARINWQELEYVPTKMLMTNSWRAFGVHTARGTLMDGT
jgi:hypothetical protein